MGALGLGAGVVLGMAVATPAQATLVVDGIVRHPRGGSDVSRFRALTDGHRLQNHEAIDKAEFYVPPKYQGVFMTLGLFFSIWSTAPDADLERPRFFRRRQTGGPRSQRQARPVWGLVWGQYPTSVAVMGL